MIDRRLVVLVMVVLAGCDSKEEAPSALAQAILGSAAGSAATAKSGSAATTPAGSAAGSAGAAAVPAAGSGSGAHAAVAGVGSGSGSAAPAELKVGDRVLAKWTNGSWYPGKIVAIQANGTYDVNYNDGDKSRGLPASKVKRPPPPRAGGTGGKSGGGTAASDAPCPGPGLTRRCGGVCVNIQENNNHCGSCNNRCPSGKSCDGHMFCRDAEGNL